MTATARFRKGLRRRNTVVVTVFPGDGRLTEDFLFEEREIVRFAWAILADYAPEEAAQAAEESGGDLATALAAPPHALRGKQRAASAPISRGGDLHLLLSRIAAEAPVALMDLEKPPTGVSAQPRNLARTLLEKGLIARVSEGAQGRPSSLAPTLAGERALAALKAAGADGGAAAA